MYVTNLVMSAFWLLRRMATSDSGDEHGSKYVGVGISVVFPKDLEYSADEFIPTPERPRKRRRKMIDLDDGTQKDKRKSKRQKILQSTIASKEKNKQNPNPISSSQQHSQSVQDKLADQISNINTSDMDNNK